ncbi:hypothetical protein RIF29_09762 [Crotalaria pallida]|uniref:Uncharacterized protein n=1 Tax=Crotalaria pallida TaxID=3830 RepID=A0AAN9IJL0_CROPI
MLGFESVHFARIDYQDRDKHKADKSLEVVWRGSKTFGSSAQILPILFPIVMVLQMVFILKSMITRVLLLSMSSLMASFLIVNGSDSPFQVYLMYGDISTKAAHMLSLPKVSDFFTRLIQRVSPKSYQQAFGEVYVALKFLENFGGDQDGPPQY